MSQLRLAVPHRLGQEEATRRLKARIGEVKERFAGEVRDFAEQWNGHALDFRFSAFGFDVAGMLRSEPSEVQVLADLPFAAVMFQGLIERQIREDLAALLGDA